MWADEKEIKEQMKLIELLVKKLKKETEAEHTKTFVVKEHIKRLRAELQELSHMHDWDYKH